MDHSESISALKQALLNGTKKVRYENGSEVREITYRDLDEIKQALALLEQQTGADMRRDRTCFVTYNRHR